MTNAIETASREEVSEKGMLKGDHGVAAHPGCYTARVRVNRCELEREEKESVCVCECACVRE